MCSIICIQSFASGGATTLALNMAIHHAQKNPKQRVALCQVSMLPDVGIYCGFRHTHSYRDMVRFIQEDEWNESTLSQCTNSYYEIDIFSSPFLDEWKDISDDLWDRMVSDICHQYDVVYLDMPMWLAERIQKPWKEKIQSILHVLPPTPAGFELLKKASSIENIIINQCPPKKEAFVQTLLSPENTEKCRAVLPIENDVFWDQVYECFPVACQKKSKWKKAFEDFYTSFHNISS